MDWMEILRIILDCIGGCAIAASITPNSSKNTPIDWGLRALNRAGMNFHKARNR